MQQRSDNLRANDNRAAKRRCMCVCDGHTHRDTRLRSLCNAAHCQHKQCPIRLVVAATCSPAAK